jgi:probable rRNA maturation factor
MSVEIANESGAEVDEASLAALARHVLDSMRVHPLAELSVLLVDVPAMTDLHQRWLGEPGPTDVLAFPMDELRPPPHGAGQPEHGPDDSAAAALLGDVVLCPEVALEQARQAQHDVRDELDLLCTHGILHLLGYDHAEPEEQAAMFGLQDRLLAAWRAQRENGSSAAVAGQGAGDATPGAEGTGAEGTAGAPGGTEPAGEESAQTKPPARDEPEAAPGD